MKDDTISRAAAIDALNGLTDIFLNNLPPTIYKADAVEAVKALPSATDTNVGGNLIDRGEALDALDRLEYTPGEWATNGLTMCKDAIKALPPAQPEPEEFEWCHTCREYDQEKHCCHRWTKVIRKTVDDMKAAQPGWIPWDSGRFPEESGTYTVTAYDGAAKRVTYAKYQKRLKRWELTGARAYWRVLAWMPHIEPWEGEKDAGET